MPGPNHQPNILHQFASYNTIFTLSALTEDELRSHAFLNTPVHDIIARTGGIGDPNVSTRRPISVGIGPAFTNKTFDYESEATNSLDDLDFDYESDALTISREDILKQSYDPSIEILKKGKDIFFENVNILSTVGPNSERGLANFTKMEFQLHEPFGISLIEKVRAAAFVNGFTDYQDAPMLLTIEFKGFDEHGRPKQAIPSFYGDHPPSRKTDDVLIRKIPILITKVRFDVTEGGAKYDLTAVPFGDLAHDDRFKFPRTVLNVSCTNVEEWAQQVAKQLNEDQIEREIKVDKVREFADVYEFIVDDKLKKLGKYRKAISTNINENTAGFWRRLANDFILGEKTKADLANPKIELAEGVVDGNTSLVKYFEDAVRLGEGFQILVDRFWLAYASLISGDQDRFRLKKPGPDAEKAVYADLRNYLLSEQFQKDARSNQWVDWFEIKTTVETDTTRFDYIRKQHPKKIIYKAIPKKIHVLKFIRPGMSLGNVDWSQYVKKEYDYIYTGDNVDVQELNIEYKSAYYLRNVRPFDKSPTEAGEYKKFEQNLQEALGVGAYPEPGPQLRQDVSTVKGKNALQVNDGLNEKSQEFYDYITNPEADMIRIELGILGDPAYICQDQYIPIHKNRNVKPVGIGDGEFSNKYGSFNSENFQPLIKLNYRAPADIEEKTQGLTFTAEKGTTELFFNGIYQVVRVDSTVQQGSFTQTLTCVRLNNQQGENKGVSFSDIDKVGLDKNNDAEAVYDKTNFRHGINRNFTEQKKDILKNIQESAKGALKRKKTRK